MASSRLPSIPSRLGPCSELCQNREDLGCCKCPNSGTRTHLKYEGTRISYMGMDQYLLITIFRGMNIHLPAILMFTRGTSFDTLPYTPSIINHKYIHELKKQRIRNCNISQIQISHFRFCQVQQSQNLAEWSCWAIPATLITGEFCTAVAVFEAPAQRPRNEHTLALHQAEPGLPGPNKIWEMPDPSNDD